METNTAIATTQTAGPMVQQKAYPAELLTSTSDWLNPLRFDQLQRAAIMVSKSQMVPKEFRDNVGDCAMVLSWCNNTGMDPFQAFQALYFVHGRLGWYTQALIAQVNSSGKLGSSIRFRMTGERGKPTWGCVAYATDKHGDLLEGVEVSMQMAEAEGWVGRNPKWRNMTELMLRYRAATVFISQFCPECKFGLATKEELEDTTGEVDHQHRMSKNDDVRRQAATKTEGDDKSAAMSRWNELVGKVGSAKAAEALQVQPSELLTILEGTSDEIYSAIDVIKDKTSAETPKPRKPRAAKPESSEAPAISAPQPGASVNSRSAAGEVPPAATSPASPSSASAHDVIARLASSLTPQEREIGERLKDLDGRALKIGDEHNIVRAVRIAREKGVYAELDALIDSREPVPFG